MKQKIYIFLLILILVLMVLTAFAFQGSVAHAEDNELEPVAVYVLASQLNGRYSPRKTGIVEALFDRGDALIATGKWSKDHKWIEVVGGECGTVWVDYRYVTERLDPYVAVTYYKRTKIRNRPFNGKVVGYLKEDKKILIDQVVLGWGHCSKGWIDLEFLTELEGEEL
jgi:hypothetical protein